MSTSFTTHPAAPTRRAFLRGMGAATFAGAALAAAPASASEQAGAPAWDSEADVIVVGLGGAGVVAAIRAHEQGASVLVIETSSRGGGSTFRSGGLIYMGGGTQLQKDLGVEDTPEAMKAYVTALAGPSADPALIDVFCDTSVELYDWLVSHGVVFGGTLDDTSHSTEPPAGVSLMYSGNERAWEYASIATPAPRGHAPSDAAMGLFEPLEAEVEGFAEMHYETTGTALVTDEAGAVIGVRAIDADGNDVAYKASKGVILSAGAFTYNDAMLADYAADALLCGSRTGCETDRGEGILMGQRIGAATRSMGSVNFNRSIYLYGDLAAGALVDYNGLRYLCEDWHGGKVGLTISQHSPEKGFIIIDNDVLQLAMSTPYGAYLQPVAQADTIDELAAAIGVPASNLAYTVERYNGFCESGEDTDYHKSPEYLKPIVTPPFSAITGAASSCGFHTLGGLKIDAQARVINLDGAPIEGLYAAGRTACGFFGRYPGSGSSIGDGMTFGYVAGTSAAAR